MSGAKMSKLHYHQMPPNVAATRMQALDWKSIVTDHKVTLEHAAVDINTDRVLYHMEMDLAVPLPASALQHTEFLCLTWPIGGLWKIESVSSDYKKLKCISWRKTTMNHHEVDELAKQLSDQQLSILNESTPTLFDWKMMRGVWGTDQHHWFIRDIHPPTTVPMDQRQLLAKLFVGFAPLEAQIEINSIAAIDTVAQTFSADVTWQVTLPAITAIREDSVLRELLEVLELDAAQFEFTNINAMQEERDLASSVTPAGEAQFNDLTLAPDQLSVEPVYHLQYSRRVIAAFSEEMRLHNFPFDQQKLTFDLSTSSGMPEGVLRMVPTPVEPGRFAIENYRLGNVFDVVYRDKVFVSDLIEVGPKKSISFEIMLERRSGYYLTNVALIAACITYLCFITYARGVDGSFMDTSSRLQIVLTLLLTAVTFKNQVASLIPQVSYFTTLDKYVFFCFMVTCLVTLENAFSPTIENHFPEWKEDGLLAFSCGAFTLVNVVWALYLKRWISRRARAATALLDVYEYIKVITDAIPATDRDGVLREFLVAKKMKEWKIPDILVTCDHDLHVQLPDDSPDEHRMEKKANTANMEKQRAQLELSEMKKIHQRLRPGAVATASTAPGVHTIPAMRPTMANEAATDRRASIATPPAGRTRRSSNPTPSAYVDTVVNVEPFRRHHDGDRQVL